MSLAPRAAVHTGMTSPTGFPKSMYSCAEDCTANQTPVSSLSLKSCVTLGELS